MAEPSWTATPTRVPSSITWSRVDGHWLAKLTHTTVITLPADSGASQADLDRHEEFLRRLDDVLDAYTTDALQACATAAAKGGAK